MKTRELYFLIHIEGASVAEWLESLTFNHLSLTAVGSIPGLTGSQNISCEEAIQLAYGKSVVLPRCPLGHD